MHVCMAVFTRTIAMGTMGCKESPSPTCTPGSQTLCSASLETTTCRIFDLSVLHFSENFVSKMCFSAHRLCCSPMSQKWTWVVPAEFWSVESPLHFLWIIYLLGEDSGLGNLCVCVGCLSVCVFILGDFNKGVLNIFL